MGLIFGNPAGFWALLGIPVILLIHFLQKERREIITSTLFLLENMQRESKSGIRFERLRSSLPLWLQILSILLLTWLLVQPLRLKPDSYQRSVILLDSSASMSVFQNESLAALDKISTDISRASRNHEWILLETDPRKGTLYSGDDRNALLDSGKTGWNPFSGTHSPVPAINSARNLLHGSGNLIFITNRSHDGIPSDVHQIAVGSPIDNVGFTGIRIERDPEGPAWQLLLKNHGNTPQSREWRAVFDQISSEPQTVHLDPGQTISLRGRFPENTAEGFLQLSGDHFPADDWLPLLPPIPKPLAINIRQDKPTLLDFTEKFLSSLSDWHPSADSPDLLFSTRNPDDPPPADPGIHFFHENQPPGRFLSAPIVAENHPLTNDLNWQGLLIQINREIEPAPNDRVLLWQGSYPLIVLQTTGNKSSLLCNFDLRHSNATRLPSFIILLHRFIDEVRTAKPVFTQTNLETGQAFPIAANPLGPPLSLTFRNRSNLETKTESPARAQILFAPNEPGFLDIRQGETPLLRAAIHFADSRQADFRNLLSQTSGPDPKAAILEKNTKADFLAPLWLLALTGLILTNWWFTGRRSRN